VSIITHSMPYEDDVFAPDSTLEDLLTPDEDELALMRFAKKRSRALGKKKREQEIKKKVVLSMLDGKPGSSLISGSRNENMGPIVEEREREFLQDIFNPLHNARQIAKELSLLEDHLIQPPQHCPDCIRKHLLRAEAYSDEASSLDEAGDFVQTFGDVSQELRSISRTYLREGSQPSNRHAMAQRVRKLRKGMSKMGFQSVLGSRMKGDAPAQPYLSEPLNRGSFNAYGDDFGKRRKRSRRKSGNGHFGDAPPGEDWSDTVGSGGETLSKSMTAPRKDVYQLQEFLKGNDLIRFDPNGIYDANTENAVAVLSRGAGVEAPRSDAKFDQRLYRIFITQDLPAPNGRSSDEAITLAKKIRKLQRAQEVLVKLDLLTDDQRRKEEDGVAGPKTQAAIREFQRRQGSTLGVLFDADGIPVEPTLDAILDKSNQSKVAFNKNTAAPTPVSIEDAQRFLIDADLMWAGEVTGNLDEPTVSALQEFQSLNGVSGTGKLDDATKAKLADPNVRQRTRAAVAASARNPQGQPWSRMERGAPTSSSSPAPSAARTMDLGEAQRRLNRAGHRPALATDGVMGDKTKRAILDFQRALKLNPSGILDSATVAKLYDDDVLERLRAQREATRQPAPTPSTAPTAPAMAPTAPSMTPAAASAPVSPVRLPRDYAADPSGSNVAMFKSKYPTLAQSADALLARERQLRALARFGGDNERQISKLARDWWALSKSSGDPWPALHAAWLAGKAGDTKLAANVLSDVSSRFVGTAAGNAASAAMVSLPAEESFIDKIGDAAPYIAAGAGLLLVTGLLFRGSR